MPITLTRPLLTDYSEVTNPGNRRWHDRLLSAIHQVCADRGISGPTVWDPLNNPDDRTQMRAINELVRRTNSGQIPELITMLSTLGWDDSESAPTVYDNPTDQDMVDLVDLNWDKIWRLLYDDRVTNEQTPVVP